MDNTNVSKHLGKVSEYKSTYDSSLLVREPRSSNRVHLHIDNIALPFVGYDTWNAYEVSALLSNGRPLVAVAKIVYSCQSEFIVESKSIKLYLNSFNMTKIEETSTESALRILETFIKKDLSDLLETNVEVRLFQNNDLIKRDNNCEHAWHNKYLTLEDNVNVDCSIYCETPKLLKIKSTETRENEHYYHSSLLKSNCRVTQQPDWGDVYIYYKGYDTIDIGTLLQYIVSFRDECHFHEEICEAIFKRLSVILRPSELSVKCLYARRGGIDINPQRATSDNLLCTMLADVNTPHIKTPKQ